MVKGNKTDIAVNVVRVNRIASHIRSNLDPLGHHIPDIRTVDVDPSLVPVIHPVALVRGLEIPRVGTPTLVRARAKVANDLFAERVQRRDGRAVGAVLGVVKQVNVVHVDMAGLDCGRLRVDGERVLEDYLPRRPHGWLPHRGPRLGLGVAWRQWYRNCLSGYRDSESDS